MIWGSLDPWGTKENLICTEPKRRKNEATADRKASFIKDAVREDFFFYIPMENIFIYNLESKTLYLIATFQLTELHYTPVTFIISNFSA